MPYKIRKLPNKNLYKVYNADTGRVHSKGTSKTKAKSQLRLLRAIEHGWKPSKSKSKSKSRGKKSYGKSKTRR